MLQAGDIFERRYTEYSNVGHITIVKIWKDKLHYRFGRGVDAETSIQSSTVVPMEFEDILRRTGYKKISGEEEEVIL